MEEGEGKVLRERYDLIDVATEHRVRDIFKWQFAFATICKPGKLKCYFFESKLQSDS